MRNFSSEERFGHKDDMAVKRIPELKQASKDILEIVQQAKLGNKRLLINANVQISIVEE